MYPLPLQNNNLSLPKEKKYFIVLAIFSGLVWLVVAISIIGLIYAVLIALLIWLANGMLVARLRSEGVLVSQDQFPELYQTFQSVLQTFNLPEEPEIYVIQSDGILNAFATRHSGRDFVVIYSSILEAYGYASSEMRFLIGHEIGHIRSKHLLKRLFIAPSFFLPWVPPAYSRACEASCDRFGAYASGDIDGAVSAMMTLSAGKEAATKLAPAIFARQHFIHRGFFVSWYELNSFYPTLSQRVSNLLAVKSGLFQPSERRNILAYFFAMFSLRTLIIVYLFFILGAIALPAFMKARESALNLQSIQSSTEDDSEVNSGDEEAVNVPALRPSPETTE